MQSNGGLIDLDAAAGHAAWTVLSGPAGGAAGAAFVARAAGRRDALCFDMGGTSCDVCVVDDGAVQEQSGGDDRRPPAGAADARRPHRRRRRRLDRLARRRAARCASARARRAPIPGRPATGAAAPSRPSPTPTWCSATWPPTRRWPAASRSTASAAERASAAGRRARTSTRCDCAEGIVRVANAEMVRALRVVTVERGIDPRRYALLAFGGAGGRCTRRQIADELGIDADPLPARLGRAGRARPGRLAAPPRRAAQRVPDRRRADRRGGRRAGPPSSASRRATSSATTEARAAAVYELRYRGQAFELAVSAGPDAEPERAARGVRGRARGALRLPRRRRRSSSWSRSASRPRSPGAEVALGADGPAGASAATGARRTARRRDGRARGAARRRRRPGTELDGPAVVELPESTLLVPPGWAGEVDDHGHDRLARETHDRPGRAPGPDRRAARDLRGDGRGADPLGPLGQHQGAPRRLDRAVRPPSGEMVMQAEHIPVHLGAMPAAVAAVLDEEHAPGRSWILNDPYRGGTHLPDITVITPVFAGDELIAFAANRAHHADVGGPTPGSMPADSRTLADEGVVIEPRVLDEDGDRRAQRADAPARPAPRRPARPARRRPGRRPAAGRAARAGRRRDSCARPSPRCSTTPSGARAPAWRTWPTAMRERPRRARGARGRPADRAAGDRRGRRARARLHRHAPPSTTATSTARWP